MLKSTLVFVGVKFMRKLNMCDSEECMRVAASLKESMNTSIDPCEDFYSYVCGRWPSAHPSVDLSQANNWFREKSTKVTRAIRDLLIKNLTADELPWSVSEARTLYDSCMDVESWDKLKLVPLLELLEELSLPRIPATVSKETSNFVMQAAKVRRVLGIDIFFGMYMMPDPRDTSKNVLFFDSPERESPFPTDEVIEKRLKQIKKRSRKYAGSTRQSGDNSDDTSDAADRTFMIEVMKQLISNGTTDQPVCTSRGAFTIVPESDIEDSVDTILNLSKKFEDLDDEYSNRTSEDTDPDDYEIKDSDYLLLDEIQEITDDYVKSMNDSLVPRKFWRPFIDEVLDGLVDSNQGRKVLVGNIDYLKDVALIMASAKEDVLESLIWWTIVEYSAPFSSKSLRAIWKNYIEEVVGSGLLKSRSITCAENVEELMGMATAWLVMKQSFLSNEPHDRIREMLNLIKESFSEYVSHLKWMDKETKRVTIDKNAKMKSLIGYPSWLFNDTKLDSHYDGINITDDNYFSNMVQIIRVKSERELAGLSKDNTDDDEKWPLNPTEVNAIQSLQDNELAIPAAILQFPFYGLGLEAMNYGAIGSILGHELTHGFDDAGRLFDSQGNLKQWWSNRTISKYTYKASCFVEQYSEYYLPEINDYIDGALTLGENIADNGGLREAYRAYHLWRKKSKSESYLPGFLDLSHDQLFFLGYAHLWCESYTSKALNWMMYDSHCPGHVRVTMVLRNSKHFSNVWKCGEDSAMNPKRKCTLW
ncbi:hypothetical protein QAD02_016756 [Eretmocerus hayati]|uniref:Uncharacterized protein n=1 Tax=Eretmocerus hayati TaxID=131215 RepID=A0ACC2PCF9_9HYME|nr:hypothetical protein QAD02_016756 [Eretmocerus hayati]